MIVCDIQRVDRMKQAFICRCASCVGVRSVVLMTMFLSVVMAYEPHIDRRMHPQIHSRSDIERSTQAHIIYRARSVC